MPHPNQFEVNEAWIAFQLNDEPIRTEKDGLFNAVCLMDAASCFILGMELVPEHESEPSQFIARHLLKAAWAHKQQFPAKLLLPTDQFQTIMPAEAKRQGITVERLPGKQLQVFIAEARRGFQEHMQGKRS